MRNTKTYNTVFAPTAGIIAERDRHSGFAPTPEGVAAVTGAGGGLTALAAGAGTAALVSNPVGLGAVAIVALVSLGVGGGALYKANGTVCSFL